MLINRSMLSLAMLVLLATEAGAQEVIAPEVVERAAAADATVTEDGVVRIGWSRDDVPVEVDSVAFPPSAGLGSWAAFKANGNGGAIVMGDTVVFQDEVDAAMDAAFAAGLHVTALHNHFFYDEPKVYFMHIGGHGEVEELAAGVKAVWNAIKQVRAENPEPAERFPGPTPEAGGDLDPAALQRIVGHEATEQPGGVVKFSVGREGSAHGVAVGGSMGLSSWAAFTGSDELAVMDGDIAMKAGEVQAVMHALREHDVHIVALHNHMTHEEPTFYFLHFWGKGRPADLADAFRAALDVTEE